LAVRAARLVRALLAEIDERLWQGATVDRGEGGERPQEIAGLDGVAEERAATILDSSRSLASHARNPSSTRERSASASRTLTADGAGGAATFAVGGSVDRSAWVEGARGVTERGRG
jgi:hypothetical protein